MIPRTLVDWLKGKKTYIVSIATVLLSLLVLTGVLDSSDLDDMVVRVERLVAAFGLLLGGGLAALRAGVEKR